jgi:hypothetical protein
LLTSKKKQRFEVRLVLPRLRMHGLQGEGQPYHRKDMPAKKMDDADGDSKSLGSCDDCGVSVRCETWRAGLNAHADEAPKLQLPSLSGLRVRLNATVAVRQTSNVGQI